MRRRDVLKAFSAAPLAFSTAARSRAFAQGQAPSWNEIDSRPIPQWYTDAKFGIFIHWGVYSVPAFAAVNVKGENPYAEWYWNSLTLGKQEKRRPGTAQPPGRSTSGSMEPTSPILILRRCSRPNCYDPDHWADVFVRSGAKYVALTSKHHEGFTLWKNAQANRSWGRPWNSVDIGPKRDLLIDLTEAGRRKGLEMGIYYSLYEWYNPLWLSDKKRYVAEHMIPQFKDVVTHAKPSIIFSDGEWELPSEEWRRPGNAGVALSMNRRSPDQVVVDDRWGKDTRHKHGGYYTTEYTSGMQQSQHPWEESRGMGYSYGYNRVETLKDYHTERELRPDADRYREPRRQSPAGHRPARRRPYPGDYGRAAGADRQLAAAERRGDLRHEGSWSSRASGARGQCREFEEKEVHGGIRHQQPGGYAAGGLRASGRVLYRKR